MERDKPKRVKAQTREEYLLKAAELLSSNEQQNVAAYFVNKAAGLREERLARKEEDLGQRLTRTPTAEKRQEADKSSYFEATCQQCGTLKTPFNTRVRVKAKIRKRKRRVKGPKFSDKDSSVTCPTINDGEKSQTRKRKSARKSPLLVSSCLICKHATKIKCEVPKKSQEFKSRAKRSTFKTDVTKIGQDSTPNITMKVAKVLGGVTRGSETPTTSQNLLSKSAKKRQRMRNSPLTKLLNSETKTKPKESPSLLSFLFDK